MAALELLQSSSGGYEFNGLEELDPSLANGYRILFEREVPFEVRNSNSADPNRQQGGTLELIRVKILTLGPDEAPTAIRMELSSEVDLFFHYMHAVDERAYSKIQDSQKLMVDMADYPSVLVRMLNACIKEPHINLGIFTMLSDTEARLDFIQNMEYKFVELMYCACVRSPEEIVQQHITFRYNSLKQKLSVMQSRLQEINNLVKIKNPSLLLQLQKTSSASLNSTGLSASTSGSTQHASPPPNSTTSISQFQKPFR